MNSSRFLHLSPPTSEEGTSADLCKITHNYLSGIKHTAISSLHKSGMLLLLMFLGTTVGSQLHISSDLFLNKLNMSYGINYKYNGLMYHNIHRVWIITKVVVAKLKGVKFPDIHFDPDCKFVNHLKNSMAASKHVNSIRSICKSMKPIVTLLKQKELYYESAIKGILKEEIPWSLYGLGHSHIGRTFQDPVYAGQRVLCSTMGETPVHKKKALSALFLLLLDLPQ